MSETRQLCRPMLRPSVAYRPLAGGVDFRFADRGFLLRGNLDYALVHRLVSLLNGQRALPQIEAALPPKIRPAFDLIFQNLVDHDLVIEGASDRLARPERAVPIASFLQDVSDDWEQGLAALKQCSVTVSAPEAILPTLLRSLDHAGFGAIRILQPGDSDGGGTNLAALGILAPVTFQTSAELLASPPGPGSLMLFVHHRAELLCPLIDAIDRAHDVTLPAVLFDTGALVGPSRRSGLKEWLDVCKTVELEGQPQGLSSAKVAAAQLVFDAIDCIASSPAGGPRMRNQLKLVRADGTSKLVALDVLLATRRIRAQTPASKPVAVLKDGQEAWRDHEFGAFRLVPPPGPAYPLPHCAYAVATNTVWGWGISTQAAEQRAMRRACDALALLSQPVADPFLVATATDPASAMQLVQARLHVRSTDPALMHWQDVDLSQLGADDQMLCRLAHLYWDKWPQLRTSRIADGCWLAKAKLGEETVIAIELSLATATSEALGEVVSARQMEQPSAFQRLCQTALQAVDVLGDDEGKGTIELMDHAPAGLCTAYFSSGAA